MTYYHVVIQKKQNKNWECIFKDLSEKELKKYMVKPYRLGKDLYYNGNILPVSELSKINIISTNHNINDTLKVIQDESYAKIQEMNRDNSGIVIISPGYGYNDEEIRDYGTNVTEKFLTEAPGSGTTYSNLLNLTKHPMIVRIIGGLIFLALVIYFGLKLNS